ncbi:hypothetical protein BpHYR1_027675 [Brachionus plicatilis]|uniref:Uncharacterized protein n=1 Tax=Brachionus plicatilis TaxID=10195 RepID=A0A3M7QCK9_BRAPC|nr:hypothetical protein BpHYR1_027675 [Brachionus plicatilis]
MNYITNSLHFLFTTKYLCYPVIWVYIYCSHQLALKGYLNDGEFVTKPKKCRPKDSKKWFFRDLLLDFEFYKI